VYREAWSVLTQEFEFHDTEDPDELAKAGEALVSKYMEEAAPRIDPAAVEMRVEGVIAGVKVAGYIDLLDVNGCVIDIKTAKARPSSIHPMHRFQVATYRYLTTLAQGSGRIDTLVKTKSPQLIQQPFSVTEQELRAIHTIYPVAQALMRGDVHLPNRQSMLCSRRHCPPRPSTCSLPGMPSAWKQTRRWRWHACRTSRSSTRQTAIAVLLLSRPSLSPLPGSLPHFRR